MNCSQPERKRKYEQARNHQFWTILLQLTWLEFVGIESPVKHFRLVLMGRTELLFGCNVCCCCLSCSFTEASEMRNKIEVRSLLFFLEGNQGIVDARMASVGS